MSDKKQATSDKTSDKRLLPCPFCGGELELEEKGKFYIHPSGKCFMNLSAVKNSEIRIKAWNTRKPVDALLEHLEEELNFVDTEMKRCAQENPLQFDSAKGCAEGLYVAIMKIKEMLT